MLRHRALLLVVLAACSGKPKSNGNLVPESQLDGTGPTTPRPSPPAAEAPAAEPPAPVQLDPLSVTIPPPATKVKLLGAGKGTRAPLRLAPAAGAQQTVDLLMNAHIEQSATGLTGKPEVMPQVRVGAAVEVQAAGADGAVPYRAVVISTGASDVAGQSVTTDSVERQLTSLVGMTIQGTVSPTGAAGATTYHVESPTESTTPALSSMLMMMPTWPLLPNEPVGLGATWEVTTEIDLNGIRIAQVAVYTLRGRSGTTATITGDIKVVGQTQRFGDFEASDIGGKGTSEIVLDSSKLYPKMKREVTTSLRLLEGGEDKTVVMRLGAAFEPR